jgi:hypothetical protein
VRHSFQFDLGPVIVICPTAPPEVQGQLADEQDPNFTKMRQYGDLHALIELYGHLRAENPNLDVFHRTTTVMADDFSSHVILLEIRWSKAAARFQPRVRSRSSRLPWTTWRAEIPSRSKRRRSPVLLPQYEDRSDGKELIADMGLPCPPLQSLPAGRILAIATAFTVAVCSAPSVVSSMHESEKQTSDTLQSDSPVASWPYCCGLRVWGTTTLSPDLQELLSHRFAGSRARRDCRQVPKAAIGLGPSSALCRLALALDRGILLDGDRSAPPNRFLDRSVSRG